MNRWRKLVKDNYRKNKNTGKRREDEDEVSKATVIKADVPKADGSEENVPKDVVLEDFAKDNNSANFDETADNVDVETAPSTDASAEDDDDATSGDATTDDSAADFLDEDEELENEIILQEEERDRFPVGGFLKVYFM